MDIFDYVAFSRPDEAYELLGEYSSDSPRSKSDLANTLRRTFQGLRFHEHKSDFLIKLAEIHPDTDLFTDLNMEDEEISNESRKSQPLWVETSKLGADGESVSLIKDWFNSSVLNNKNDSIQLELNNIKTEATTSKLLNERLFKVGVVIVLSFIAFKLYKSNNK